MTATALSSHIDVLIDDVPKLAFKLQVSTSSGAATATTTSPVVSQMSASASADRLTNRGLWIPSAAAAKDQFRVIAAGGFSSSAGTTTFTFTETDNFGESLSDATAYILASGISPDDIINWFNDGLKNLHTDCWTPLRHGPPSADMQGSSVDSDWTESASTDAVQTTASEVLWGAQSLVVTDSGSGGGYTESVSQRVGQGKAIRVHALLKSDIGTSILQVKDASGNTQGSVSVTSEDWVYASKRVQFDSGEETFTIRLVESAASDSGDWQNAWYVKTDEMYFILPAWLDARFKIKAVAELKFHTQAETDTWLAGSVEMIRLREQGPNDSGHYRYLSREADANPYGMIVQERALLDKPLFLIVSCPYSAPHGVSALFTTYSSTNVCPQDELVAYVKYQLGKRFPQAFPSAESEGLRELRETVPATATETPPLAHFGGPRTL